MYCKSAFYLGVFCICLAAVFNLSAQNSTPEKPDSAAVDTTIYPMNEVVVTATRYEKKIIDIPYPVVRFDNVQYRYNRKAGVSDVLSNVPGLFLQSRYGNHDARISIRGFGSQSNSGIRGVRILLDGIPESEPDGQTRIEAIDFNSVGRIEIVRGNFSSLYTNAPGGVINFLNDIYFPSTFALSFNDFGSFDLRRNGFKAGFRGKKYAFLLTYGYHNYKGYRAHSEDYWHIANSVLDIELSSFSNLQVLGYYVDGQIRLPGSLTREEFDADPYQAAEREEKLDFRRLSKKGRIGIRYQNFFDASKRNEVLLTLYGTIKYFERPSNSYRIINRFGLGGRFRYLNRSTIGGRKNEFSIGGDALHQTGPVENYNNIGGIKGDQLTSLTNSTVANRGIFVQDSYNLIPNRLDALATARWEKIIVDSDDRLLGSRSDRVSYEKITPKAGINVKLTPNAALYSSYGWSFNVPAKNELDNPPAFDPEDPYIGKPFNHRLKPARARNFELGFKGNFIPSNHPLLRRLVVEVTGFKYLIKDEIVPYEILSEVFYRNSAQTDRTGLEIGGDIQFASGFNVNLAYTFSDFSYQRYTTSTIELDSTGNFVTRNRDFSGNTVPSTPRHNLYLTLTYEHDLRPGLTLFLKAAHWNTSGMYVDDRNSAKTDGYQIFNSTAGIDYRAGRMNLLFSFGVDNIFDKTYVAFTNTNSANGRFYEAGAPRNYYGSLNLGWTL